MGTIKKRSIVTDGYYTIQSLQEQKAVTVNPCGEVYLSPSDLADTQQWQAIQASDGWYRLFSKAAGKALDIIAGGTDNGAWVHQWDAAEADSQLWKLEPVSDGAYRIISKASGRVLDIVDMNAADGAHLQIWDDVGGENQTWNLQAIKKPRARKSPVKEAADTPKKTAPKRAAAKKMADDLSTDTPKPRAPRRKVKPDAE